MQSKFIALVGACYIDTILETPHFPEEDSKLRALSISKRRGGNGPNSAEVLAQLANRPWSSSLDKEVHTLNTLLITVLPNKNSTDFQFVKESLPEINFEHCIHRDDKQEAPKSFIIRSQSTNSRTIVNFNELDEMTVEEFSEIFETIKERVAWWHFEGRIPDVTKKCVEIVRQNSRAGISIEVEKPAREGLEELSLLADFVFYSRTWAMHTGFSNLKAFLASRRDYYLNSPESQVKRIFCTWGEQGAGTIEVHTGTLHIAESKLPEDHHVVDTVGAGDVFIAMALWMSFGTISDWSHNPEVRLGTAVRLCERKVCQEGFSNLFE